MPIDFLGYTFWVSADNRDIDEYKVEVEDANTVSCYIPSQVDKEFKICWADESPLKKSVIACHMDGRPVGGKPSQPHTTGCMEGVYTPTNKIRPFRFSQLNTTDDDDIAHPEGTDPDLGCIHIEIHRVDFNLRKDWSSRERRGQVHEVGPVHERSKKLGAHCVSLGDEQNCRAPEFFVPKYTSDGPYAVFRFIYRPMELLKARGIVPPPPDIKDVKPSVDIKPDLAHPRVLLKVESGEAKPTQAVKGAGPSSRIKTEQSSGRIRSQTSKQTKQHKLTPRERRGLKQEMSLKKEEDEVHGIKQEDVYS